MLCVCYDETHLKTKMLFFLLLKKRAVGADVYRMLVVVGIILLINFQPFRIGLDSNVSLCLDELMII